MKEKNKQKKSFKILSLAVDGVVVALTLVILVSIPSIVSLLLVDSVSAVSVFLAIVKRSASSIAGVILRLGVSRTPPVRVDLEETIVSRTICVLVRSITVEGGLVLGNTNHGGNARLREASVSQVRSGLALALVVRLNARGEDRG